MKLIFIDDKEIIHHTTSLRHKQTLKEQSKTKKKLEKYHRTCEDVERE